jgi:hypothetical protein
VASGKQLADDTPAYEAGASSNEDSHACSLFLFSTLAAG